MGSIGSGVLKTGEIRRSSLTPAAMEERTAAADVDIERTKFRCKAVIDRIHTLFPPNLKKKTSSSSSSRGCYETLVRLAHAELSFLSRSNSDFISLSSNIGHIEAVLHILQQPFVKGVSRVCKPIPLSGLLEEGQKCTSKIHVDIVCTLNGKPVWFLVSARNPKYVFWDGPCGGQNKSLRTRILQVINAAARSSAATKPSSIILFFSNGLNESVRLKLEVEFEASKFELDLTDFDILSEELESDWVYVICKSYRQACIYEIKVDRSSNTIGNDDCEDEDSLVSARTGQALLEESIALKLGSSFCQLVSRMKLPKLNVEGLKFDRLKDLSGEADLINFDTTALIAIVSGISNGGAKELLAKSEGELRQRFKGNVEFVIAQVMSEIQSPIHADLDGVLSGKKGIICESVVSEFKQLVSMCGGPHEKSRADHLLKYLVVVPDIPSTRMMSLPTTRKLALKNKVVFGTGDYVRAPTLTANMAFARAVSQTGMSLFTIEHRPRALTGD